jgi:hypothetical protein
MLKNRFILVIGVLPLLLVAMAVSQRITVDTNLEEAERIQQSWDADTERWEAMGEYYANQATAESYQSLIEARPFIMDSATRSYIAWGQAMQARNAMDSGTRSYIAWGEALEKAKLNALDSGTRSYIAWGEALEAAGKLGDSGTCSNMTQENIFAGIPNNLDSATRSYIAWGLALQAKDDIGALCR